jgi:outer membrane biosynthesis protein TonB
MRSAATTQYRSLFIAFAISVFAHLILFVAWWVPGNLLRPAALAKSTMLRVTLLPSVVSRKLPTTIDQSNAVESGNQVSPTAEVSYHRANELTKPAQLTEPIARDIEWPAGSDVSQHLTLRVIVGSTGNALSVNVLESTLPREVEAEIVKRFYVASYQPGEINRHPVVSEMLVSIDLQ